jgi:hypothetical protein
VVITVRHVGAPERLREPAKAADTERQKEAWPVGLLTFAIPTGGR